MSKRCPYCDREYPDREGAMGCAKSHDVEDVITVSFLKEDFNRLVMFIMLRQPELMTERLYKKLTRMYKK